MAKPGWIPDQIGRAIETALAVSKKYHGPSL
jgi:hypothetical protein